MPAGAHSRCVNYDHDWIVLYRQQDGLAVGTFLRMHRQIAVASAMEVKQAINDLLYRVPVQTQDFHNLLKDSKLEQGPLNSAGTNATEATPGAQRMSSLRSASNGDELQSESMTARMAVQEAVKCPTANALANLGRQ